MPSTYAHYRMGQQVRSMLDGNEKKIVEKYPQLYLIGLHGPDILFYYKPLKSNAINSIGYELHKHSGKEFFERARKVISEKKDREPYLAYTYGVLNHFALDVSSHGYIEQKINESGISHAEIEVEFDRELMIMDKKNPITQSLVRHIIPSEENAKVISEFYPGTTMQEVKKALEGMISYNNLLVAPSHLKRWFIYLLLKLSGNYKEMHGLIVNYHKNKECNDSTVKLLSLYRHAKNTAYQSIIKFDGFLNNACELDKAFNYSFGSVLIEGCDNNQKQCISDNIQNMESFIKKEVQYEG